MGDTFLTGLLVGLPVGAVIGFLIVVFIIGAAFKGTGW